MHPSIVLAKDKISCCIIQRKGVDAFGWWLRSVLHRCDGSVVKLSWKDPTTCLWPQNDSFSSKSGQGLPPPSSAANLNCTWTATSRKTHSVLYFRETLWNIIGPFTEFCLDRQGIEEAFTLWVPYTLIIVQVTIASGPNKRCLRKQGIRHQLWFMGSWKKCSTQKITHRPSLLSVV